MYTIMGWSGLSEKSFPPAARDDGLYSESEIRRLAQEGGLPLVLRAERNQEGLAARLEALNRMLQSLGYEATLARGYVVVRGDGAVVTGVKAAEAAASLEIQFADGRLVLGGKPKKTHPPKTDQGSLF